MRTPFLSLTGVMVLGLLAGCTQKIEPPSVAGPSTMARAITITANKDTLFQNGVDFVEISVTSTSPTGQPQAVPLRAEIMVGGVVQDFGTLSTKNPVTPTTMRYTAPNASPNPAGQVPQDVTIVVTPTDSGDFRAEVARQVSLRLVPQGVILPTNPKLEANFSVTPASPMAFATATFDASSTRNDGVACLNLCTYTWNFGDGTTGAGITTSHTYRTVGSYLATLTVTDARGAQSTLVRSVVVNPSTPPSPVFTYSPQPAVVGQDIFFNAETSTAAPGRTIVNYGWNFGDGRTASGVTVARSYPLKGKYIVTLRVTDDAGATNTDTEEISVEDPQPVPAFTVTPSSPANNQLVLVNASSTTGPSPIVSYLWDFGTNASPSTGTNVSSSTTYTIAPGSLPAVRVITLTVTDAAGRTATTSRQITVQ